jgi:hypothetical protein
VGSASPRDQDQKGIAPQGSGENTADAWQPKRSSALAEDLLSYRRSRPEPRNLYGSFLFSLRARLLFTAVLVGIGIVGLYMCGGGVTIYVDNGGKEPMVVTVDDKEAATIAPGEFAKIDCQPGEKHFLVRCGQETLFDGIKDLKKPEKLASNRRYFFNPDNRNRYRTYTVKYGSSPLEGLIQFERGTPVGEHRRAIRDACRELAAEAKLLPPDPWFEVLDGAHVLTKAPEYVSTKRFTETRTVMTRVDPQDYALIIRARENKDPSEDDLKALIEVVDRVLESEP